MVSMVFLPAMVQTHMEKYNQPPYLFQCYQSPIRDTSSQKPRHHNASHNQQTSGLQNPFAPFVVLPYFTSKFRFCLIEQNVLTTPLLYVLSGDLVKALVPILNCSVVDFMIRYHTKSRDTGYEFKMSTFDNIRIPSLTNSNIKQMEILMEMVRTGEVSRAECDTHIIQTLYTLTNEEVLLIQEAKTFWFKKNVLTLLNQPTFLQHLHLD